MNVLDVPSEHFINTSMGSATTSTFEEGRRAFTISKNDHRGVVLSVAVLFIIYAFMIGGMRLAARMRTMGPDDYLAILATVSRFPKADNDDAKLQQFFAVIQFATVIGAVSHFLGASYDQYSSNDAATVAKVCH